MSPETVKLEDAMLAIIDYRGKTPPKSDSGKWLVTAKVVKDGFIREQPKEFIAESAYDNWMRRGLPELGDILVTTEAPLGQVAAIRSTADIALAQRLILLRADPDVLCQDFLLYSMQAPFVQHQLQARATGTTVLGIKQSELRKIQLPKPPMPLQLAIARALRGFDDLIENNRRRIEILEEMARLVYREWFVHFRFPGHEDVELVDSELGRIPEGWEVARFSGLVTESKKSVAENEIPPGSTLVGLEHLPRRSTTLTEWDVAENVGSRRKVFASGDILFGKIRPYFHKVVDAPMEGYSSTDAIVFRPSEYPERALSVASSDEFVAVAVATSNGTKMPRANTDLLLQYAIPEPPSCIAVEFEKRVAPISVLRRNLSQQNRVLREARGLLLPRLVSGELDVSEADLDGVLA